MPTLSARRLIGEMEAEVMLGEKALLIIKFVFWPPEGGMIRAKTLRGESRD